MAYQSMVGLSSAHHWVFRAAAFDQWIDQERQKLLIDDMARVRQANVRSISMLRQIAENEITKHLARSEEDPSVPISTLKEAVDMLAQLIRMETMLHGEKGLPPSLAERASAAQLAGARWNLEALALEELEALERARERAGGAEPVSLDPSPRPN